MLLGFSCRCGSAPKLFRQFLFENHVPDYMSIPLRQGKEALDYAMNNSLLSLATYINNRSSYVIVAGHKKGDLSDLEWVDINNADLERKVKAEMLVEWAV